VPTIGGIDLSPLVFLLLLQVLAIAGGQLRFMLVRLLLGGGLG
jgi:YggT family protein